MRVLATSVIASPSCSVVLFSVFIACLPIDGLNTIRLRISNSICAPACAVLVRGVVLRRDLDHVAADDVRAPSGRAGSPAPRASSGRRSPACRCPARRPDRGCRCRRRRRSGRRRRPRGRARSRPAMPRPVDLLGVDHGHAGIVGELPQIFRRAADADLDRALRVEHAVEHRLAERAAVVELRSGRSRRRCRNARRYGSCRPAGPCADRLQDRQRDRMVAADRQRRDAGVDDAGRCAPRCPRATGPG